MDGEGSAAASFEPSQAVCGKPGARHRDQAATLGEGRLEQVEYRPRGGPPCARISLPSEAAREREPTAAQFAREVRMFAFRGLGDDADADEGDRRRSARRRGEKVRKHVHPHALIFDRGDDPGGAVAKARVPVHAGDAHSRAPLDSENARRGPGDVRRSQRGTSGLTKGNRESATGSIRRGARRPARVDLLGKRERLPRLAGRERAGRAVHASHRTDVGREVDRLGEG